MLLISNENTMKIFLMFLNTCLILVALLLLKEVHASTQKFKLFSDQSVPTSFVQAYMLSSFTSKSLIICLGRCLEYCQCGTVTYENNVCTLYNAVPLISQISSAPGTKFYMSKLESLNTRLIYKLA